MDEDLLSEIERMTAWIIFVACILGAVSYFLG